MTESKMRPVHPGELLRREIEEGLGMTMLEAAKALRMARPHLYKVVDGKVGITAETALKIGRLVGNGPGLWLRMQNDYDLRLARWRLADELEKIPQPSREHACA